MENNFIIKHIVNSIVWEKKLLVSPPNVFYERGTIMCFSHIFIHKSFVRFYPPSLCVLKHLFLESSCNSAEHWRTVTNVLRTWPYERLVLSAPSFTSKMNNVSSENM